MDFNSWQLKLPVPASRPSTLLTCSIQLGPASSALLITGQLEASKLCLCQCHSSLHRTSIYSTMYTTA